MIEQGDIIELDHNKKYLVMSTAMLNNEKYLYLMSVSDEADIKFCIEADDEMGKKVIELGEDEDITEIAKALYAQGIEGAKRMEEEANQEVN